MLVPAVATGKEPAKPISVDTIQVLKISAEDERAIIKDADGKTIVVKPGDPVGISGKVLEIAADRVVIEEKTRNETEKVIIRFVDGKQKVERLRKTRGQSPPLHAPAETENKIKKQGNSVNY